VAKIEFFDTSQQASPKLFAQKKIPAEFIKILVGFGKFMDTIE
jgi:hypothetical protein